MEPMNTNRYIPGDWVKFEGKLARIEEVNSLYYLLREYYENYDPDANDEDCYLYKEAKDVEPIPLTPKILEKSGWKLCYGFYFSTNEEGVIIRLSSQTGYVWDAYVGIRPLRSGINNVSDLQHLLFGLGINSEIKVTETVL